MTVLRSGFRQATISLTALAAIALGVAACGGDDGSDDQPTPTVVSSATLPSLDTGLVAQGETFFSQFNCAMCHSVTGEATSTGPALNGIFGTERKLSGADPVVADEEYLRRAITNPNGEIVEGYPGAVMAAAMSNVQAQLSEPEVVNALVEYIKSLPASD